MPAGNVCGCTPIPGQVAALHDRVNQIDDAAGITASAPAQATGSMTGLIGLMMPAGISLPVNRSNVTHSKTVR